MTELEITISDNKKEFNIPTEWNEVTIDKFIKFIKFTRDKDKLSLMDLMKVVSIFTDIDINTIAKISQNDFNIICKEIGFITKDITTKPKNKIEIIDETFYLIDDFSKFKIAEIANIESLIKNNDDDIILALPQILTIFLRKKENGNFEEFNLDFLKDRPKLFEENVIIADVYNIISFFFAWKKMTQKKHYDLFKTGKKNKDEKKPDGIINKQTQLSNEWKWHKIIHLFCKEFNYQPDDVWNMNYISSLNYLSYLQENNRVENNKINNK